MKNGFTLIEMMGVIILLGVLSVIIIGTVSINITNSRKETCKVQEANVIDAAKAYFIDNPEELPDRNVGIRLYVVSDLEKKGYLEDGLLNPMTEREYNSDTYVEVLTDNGSNYNYRVIYKNEKNCDGKRS